MTVLSESIAALDLALQVAVENLVVAKTAGVAAQVADLAGQLANAINQLEGLPSGEEFDQLIDERIAAALNAVTAGLQTPPTL